jgi:hypothetical protein
MDAINKMVALETLLHAGTSTTRPIEGYSFRSHPTFNCARATACFYGVRVFVKQSASISLVAAVIT